MEKNNPADDEENQLDLTKNNHQQQEQQHSPNDNANWKYGKHCEGSYLKFLFGLLFYHIIFDTNVPNVFYNSYQSAPLDLYSTFYINRKQQIDDYLLQLKLWNNKELSNQIELNWSKYCHISCYGINWNSWSLKEILIIANCFGTQALADIFLKFLYKILKHIKVVYLIYYY